MDIRLIELEPTEARVESGAVQFSRDWPGLFLRGDDVLLTLRPLIEEIIQECPSPYMRLLANRLMKLTQSVEGPR